MQKKSLETILYSAAGIAVMLVILLIRPHGLFGRAEARAV